MGPGHLTVTFAPGGEVTAVNVEPPYADTEAGKCIADRFKKLSVPPFAGAEVTVGKSFAIAPVEDL